MLKKVLNHSFLYAVGPQLPRVVGLFLLPVITPYLTEVDFGVWGTIMAFTSIFTVARDLGLVVPLLNSYYKSPFRWRVIWGELYYFLLLFGVVFALIQAFVIFYISPVEVSVFNKWMILALLSAQAILFDVPNIFGLRYFQIAQKPLIVASVSVLTGFIGVFVQYYCVVILRLGYMSWFYAGFSVALVSSICYTVLLFYSKVVPICNFRKVFIWKNLKVSLPLLPHNYSAYLLNASDRVVMKVYDVSTFNIGKYNVAYMWGNYIDIVGGAVGMAVGPMYYNFFRSKHKESFRFLIIFNNFLQILFVFGSFVVAIWSKELFSFFIKNNDLKDAYVIASIIIMGYCYRPMYWLVVNKLQFYEKTSALWKISVIGGLLNVVLNLIFIKIYGYKAAAFTTFIALMYIGFSGFFLKAFKKLDSHNYKPVIWLILILFLTVICYFVQDSELYIKVILSIISTLVILYFSLPLTKIPTIHD